MSGLSYVIYMIYMIYMIINGRFSFTSESTCQQQSQQTWSEMECCSVFTPNKSFQPNDNL